MLCAIRKSILAVIIVAGVGLSSFGCRTTQSPAVAQPALASASAAPAAKQKSADQLFLEGTAAYENGRDEEARALLTAALEGAPGLVNAQYDLGVIAERQGQLGQAETAYQAALRIDPSHAPSAINLGRIYLRKGDFAKAVALFEGVQQPSKGYELALLNNLAAAYRLAGKYEKSEATSRSALAKHGENVEAMKNLLLVFFEQGQYRLAELIGISAEKINPNDPGIHNDLGLVYLKLGQRSRALGEFRRALTLDPKFEVAHRNLGALALAYRDYPTAEKSFGELVSLEPTSYEAHLHYAYALQGQQARDPSKALAAAAEFEKALAIQHENRDAICGAGWAYSEDKASLSKALDYLERCKSSGASAKDRSEIEARQRAIFALLRPGASDQQAAATPERDSTSQASEAPAAKASENADEQRQSEDGPAQGGRP